MKFKVFRRVSLVIFALAVGHFSFACDDDPFHEKHHFREDEYVLIHHVFQEDDCHMNYARIVGMVSIEQSPWSGLDGEAKGHALSSYSEDWGNPGNWKFKIQVEYRWHHQISWVWRSSQSVRIQVPELTNPKTNKTFRVGEEVQLRGVSRDQQILIKRIFCNGTVEMEDRVTSLKKRLFNKNEIYKLDEEIGEELGNNDQAVAASPAVVHSSSEEKSEEKTTEKKSDSVEKSPTCPVCLDGPSTYAFIPCGHLASCEECTQSLQACPICQGKIKGKLRVYIP